MLPAEAGTQQAHGHGRDVTIKLMLS